MKAQADKAVLDALLQTEVPDAVWEGREHTNIFCAVLFADLENSVQISRIISPAEYDALIDQYQAALLGAVEEMGSVLGIRVAEYAVAGDQLALFFYDENNVKFNYILDRDDAVQGTEREAVIEHYRSTKQELAFQALKASIYLKNQWLINPINVQRVVQHRDPYGMAIGVHLGKVFLRRRPDGKQRIEGFTVNMAKRVESFSRQGRYSRIMFSQAACNTIRGSVRLMSQLRQRVFFHRHEVEGDTLKGLGRTEIFELKFVVRIGMPKPSPELIAAYEKIFRIDETNIWAYYQLVENAFINGDWEQALRLARQAYIVFPKDEKILHDLGRYYDHVGMPGQAQQYYSEALAINPEFDLVYERLAVNHDARQDYESEVATLRQALLLSPASPSMQANLGLGLIELGQFEEAAHHLASAIQLYPHYLTDPSLAGIMWPPLERLAVSGTPLGPLEGVLAGIDAAYSTRLLDVAALGNGTASHT